MADRRAIEATLDGLVRRNRITLAVTVPLVGALLLLASSRGLLPANLVLHPALLLPAVLAMRLPLLTGLLPLLDRRLAAGLAALAGFAYAVEFVGVTTGVPYGAFEYTADLGPAIAGGVPLALPLLYVPLVLGSYLLGLRLLGRWAGVGGARILAGVAVLLLVDLVLDPGAVAAGFWAYEASGLYHGVPLSNFAGWVVSGTIAMSIVDLSVEPAVLLGGLERTPYVLDDLVSFLVLWGGVNLVLGHWAPVLVAAGLAVGVATATGVTGRLVATAPGRWPSR